MVTSRMDYEKFEDQYDDLKWMAGKAEERRNKEQKQSETDRVSNVIMKCPLKL